MISIRARIVCLAAIAYSGSALASVTLLDNNGWKAEMGGFVEVDSITDSTRSFNENIGNAPVSRPDVSENGQAGRDMMSIRNSRLGFAVYAPETESWKTRGYLEFDFLGYDPSPNTVATSSNGNTEASFFQNPTLRVRHAYIEANQDQWTLLAGQTWNLLGWQPFYFIPTVQVQPVPAMLYNRTTQLRAVRGFELAEKSHAQIGLGVMRPPQRDAALPGFEMGLRFSYDGWSGGFVGGATPPEKAQPLSVAVSGAVRRFSVSSSAAASVPTGDMDNFVGHALVFDALIPIIPSSDGKSAGNTLVVGGEYTTGTGDGDEFGGWTGGMYSPLSSASTAPTKNVNLDPGIGGFDVNNNFNLVDLNTFNLYAQYHLPSSWRTWISGGYGRLYSDNVIGLASQSFTSASSGYNKEELIFGNIMKDLTNQIRLGFEFAQVRTTYLDGTIALDNRYQLSAFFIF